MSVNEQIFPAMLLAQRVPCCGFISLHPDVWLSAVDVQAHGVSSVLVTWARTRWQWFQLFISLCWLLMFRFFDYKLLCGIKRSDWTGTIRFLPSFALLHQYRCLCQCCSHPGLCSPTSSNMPLVHFERHQQWICVECSCRVCFLCF